MSDRPQRPQDAPLKRETAASLVRDMIADGTLKPGAPVPSSAALARETGFAALTCRQALRALLADGTLARGVSPTARLRVAQHDVAGDVDAQVLRAALSNALAGRRRAAGLTQPELAGKLEVSVTTVGHAETGRTWQGRSFWLRADRELSAAGDLLRLFDRYKAAECPAPEETGDAEPEEAAPAARAGPVLPGSVTITPAGVSIIWSDGTQTLARPPRSQGGPQVWPGG
ncbi:MAG TPA: GntR family transcriptional regulator [Trebonia sp.]|jgi:DNA-binding XRE family transcriptional regulator|nr:GntR family transcriptional regulator [Trebonia sp.]